jgi:predicted ATPase
LELRAATSHARILAEQGRHSEVRDVLLPRYERLRITCSTPDLIDARDLLDGKVRPHGSSTSFGIPPPV